MSKAARLKTRRGVAGKRGDKIKGKLVFPNFPYEREFTKAELDVLFSRMDRIAETLRDAVGPQGWGLGMSEDFLQQIALHQALAGVDADGAYPAFDPATGVGAFIRPQRNVQGMHTDSIKWVLIHHDAPGARVHDAKTEAAARLKAAQEAAMRGAGEDVREAMAELMLEGSQWAQTQLEPTDEDEPAARLARGAEQ